MGIASIVLVSCALTQLEIDQPLMGSNLFEKRRLASAIPDNSVPIFTQ
jgi:hypothetical protein